MSAPLIAVVGLIYLCVAFSEYRDGNAGMAIMFLSYAFANVGAIMVAIKLAKGAL